MLLHLDEIASLFVLLKSDSSLDLTGAQATGANVNGLMSAVNDSLYLSDIGLPGSVGLSVRVRNLQSENHGLIANTTLCHPKFPPIRNKFITTQDEIRHFSV